MEEDDRRKKDTMLLAKVAGVKKGIADVVQNCAGGVQLVAKTNAAVDGVFRSIFEMRNVCLRYLPVAKLLRFILSPLKVA